MTMVMAELRSRTRSLQAMAERNCDVRVCLWLVYKKTKATEYDNFGTGGQQLRQE